MRTSEFDAHSVGGEEHGGSLPSDTRRAPERFHRSDLLRALADGSSEQSRALAAHLELIQGEAQEWRIAVLSRRSVRFIRRIDAWKRRLGLATRAPEHDSAQQSTAPSPASVADYLDAPYSGMAPRPTLRGGRGGIEETVVLLATLLDHGEPEAARSTAAAFVVVYPGIVTADWLAEFILELRQRGRGALGRVLVGSASARWPNHLGLAVEGAALAEDLEDAAVALAAWDRVLDVAIGEGDAAVRVEAENRRRALRRAIGDSQRDAAWLDPESPEQYRRWIRSTEDRSPDARQEWLLLNPAAQSGPMISVIMPVFNPDLRLLEEAIRSVVEQWYPNWELILVDDGSPDEWFQGLAPMNAGLRERVWLVTRSVNGGIAAATNDGIAAAQGEWIAFVDHDDLLAPDAFARIWEAFSSDERLRLVFTDEDGVDLDGVRHSPYFKPRVVRELMLGQNVMSHLSVYRRDLIDELGGLRLDFDGSQDWDLGLRALDRIGDDELHHIPRILYHWRRRPGSFSSGEHRILTQRAGSRAVSDALRRRGLRGVPVPVVTGGWFQIPLAIPSGKSPRVSVIIPTRDHPELLRDCVESLRAATLRPVYELVLVDNGTVDPRALEYIEHLRHDDDVVLIRDPGPFNFSRLLNRGVSAATGDVIVSLNNDVIIQQVDWLEQMVANAIRDGVGAVGVRLLRADGRVQHAGVLLGIDGVAGHSFPGREATDPGYFGQAVLQREVEAVTAAAMAVRRSLYLEVGGFDEANLPVAFNDVDFCLRLRERGLRNVYVPSVELTHLESRSRGSDSVPEASERVRREIAYMRSRWGEGGEDLIDRIKHPLFLPHMGDALLPRMSS